MLDIINDFRETFGNAVHNDNVLYQCISLSMKIHCTLQDLLRLIFLLSTILADVCINSVHIIYKYSDLY